MSSAKHTSKNGKTILISCKHAAGFEAGGLIGTPVLSKETCSSSFKLEQKRWDVSLNADFFYTHHLISVWDTVKPQTLRPGGPITKISNFRLYFFNSTSHQ